MLRESPVGRLLRRWIPRRFRPVGYLTSLAREHFGDRVAAGPFRGMKYVGEAFSSVHLPKLLGIYERELVPAVEAACSDEPRVVIDIGSAEGYYAVGFALRLPQSAVYAFESDPGARAVLQDLATLNEVATRVTILGTCDREALSLLLDRCGSGSTLIVCDAEGAEDSLLDPRLVPKLTSASMLIETHEFITPGVTDRLQGRFRATHDIQLVDQKHRSAADYPLRQATLYSRLMPDRCVEWAVSEWRPSQMSWLWMQPLQRQR